MKLVEIITLRFIYNQLRLHYNFTDFIFRFLFSLIFLGLGMEHIFSNALIIDMMPGWVPFKPVLSVLTGLILLSGGSMILLGFKTRFGATLLGLFIIAVTIIIHIPGMLSTPENIPEEWLWLWNVYQRSNFIKNLCLLGVCFHLINHRLGRYSLDIYLKKQNRNQPSFDNKNLTDKLTG